MSYEPVATASDLGGNLRVTYNGRDCGVTECQILCKPSGVLEMHVKTVLPRGWDQGPVVRDPTKRQVLDSIESAADAVERTMFERAGEAGGGSNLPG